MYSEHLFAQKKHFISALSEKSESKVTKTTNSAWVFSKRSLKWVYDLSVKSLYCFLLLFK